MPQNKQYCKPQQIIQHTSHSTSAAVTTLSQQHPLHQQPQHVQHINLAASSLHNQTHHHHPQQQQATHMIQVSEEFLEQAANNHKTGNMMISSTGEVINQQQIFKIVSSDGTTGNMIIDATNQNSNSTTTTSKVLLSNLTVLSKQHASSQGQIIGNNHQQHQTAGQTINFVNAKNLYTAAGGNITNVSKQPKFTVATTNVTNYKGATIKQTPSPNTQYIQQANPLGQQKLNLNAGNRNMQMMATRVQNSANGNSTSNVSNTSVALISNNTAPAQTMVLQQPQKFIANNMGGSKMTTTTVGSGCANIIKKSTNAGTLRMNNSHNTTTTAKLMNNLQTTQGVKTFITPNPGIQQQPQQNMNQLTVQHHINKSGSKSKFVKQYNNAILNSAGAVAIATLPHQQSSSQNNIQIQQSHQQLQPQTTYINHHKSSGSSTKINKINSKYTQPTNMAAQLPPGTQLHQKSINQTQQQQHQQFQTSGSNSNIKFVNAQGTVIQQQQQPQQQSLTTQKVNSKHHNHHHHQPHYQNLQNFDTTDGIHVFNQQANTNQTVAGTMNSSISSGTTTLPLATSTASSLLTDDVMMVNGTQMTDELSARILQSMSQKSFSNQRYQQQQQHIFQAKTSTTTTTPISNSINSSNNCNSNLNNNNMLPPPPSSTHHHNTVANNNNSSNILLSPREYTLYPTTASASTVGIVPGNQHTQQQQQQQQHSSPIHYSNSANPTATASSNITGGSFSSNNYITVSNNNNNMTITTLTPGTSAANGLLSANTTGGSPHVMRQAQSAPGSRSQSMERKLHESSMSRKSTEYYKVNNQNSLRGSSHHNNLATASAGIGGSLSNVLSVSNSMGGVVSNSTPQSPSPLPMHRPPSLSPAALTMEPQAQVIHLQATKTLPGANNSSNDDDDNIVGEEIRPAPVETEDIRLRVLHAVLMDHTYVNPMPLVLPTSFAVQLAPSSTSSATILTSTTLSGINTATVHGHQWSLGGIGAIATATSSCVAQKSYNLYGTQLSRHNQDNDSYSTLNSNSRLAIGDIDPGEETETAPEGEMEDDSVTRCICDLTHDDGYMICCDKCCAWQHVDCMGIDRQNIPDEYLCELCQPRIVDKARARSLQLMKRKEQQQQLLLSAQSQSTVGTMSAAGSASNSMAGVANLLSNDTLGAQQRLSGSNGAGYILSGNISTDSAALQLLGSGGPNLKKNKMLKKVKESVAGKRSKKSEKLAAAAAAGLSVSGKPARKETKKNTKRKKAGAHEGSNSTVGMTAAEKHAVNLRQWIENYELAVTNHYSPELRARLHAISKQPSLLQNILNTENPILKEFSTGSLDNRATTVPHAGGKILISNLDIVPNSPICELRGKYMLTTQYKTQNTSMNMNSPPPNNYHLASYKAHKTPGPFIFFYQLPGSELATSSQLVPQTTTTTMVNPDGTYTTTTTTLPAQQSPPTFLKGPEICVDTRTYGNEARFVRRSCRPNAEIQHLFEKGTIHLYIVALTDIRASTEITIRHEPHDLLAVENKKSFSMIIQPTSTSCACGLTKDCIFGPPIPQLPPVAKSNAGRKSLAHNSGGSINVGNLTAKQRKANQQNLNRNRSISSSASGDSNMGVTAAANAVPVSLNSPNNISKIPVSTKIVNNNLMPLTASCNSNLSNASSTSSTLTSIMHDSGVCTSSSSPSVSIPSPTQHLHSPIQQQTHQQQLLHSTQIKSAVPLLPQHQQQQLMQSLPTPLVLTSPNIPHPQQQQNQQSSVLQHSTVIGLQQQPLSVIAQTTNEISAAEDVNSVSEQKQPRASCLSKLPETEPTTFIKIQQHPVNHQVSLPDQHQTQPSSYHPPGLLETVSPEATIAAAALQSLNTSHSPNTSLATLASGNIDSQSQCTQVQQPQFALTPVSEMAPIAEKPQQPTNQHNQSSDNVLASASATPLTSSPQQLQQPPQQQPTPQKQQVQQQHKSPQKNNSQHNSTNAGRKTPGKHGRTTSFSEDNEQHQNDENPVTSTASSTPKEKPKLSREDRKMEAILRAIEKMERNQQRKQEQKQAKRQNAGSHNTTPTSPNKQESGENSINTKRSNNHTAAGRSKKKRKTGAKGGQGSSYNNQRKRRQSRMNSQESIDENNQQEHDAVTSGSESCAAMHSPTIQTMASLKESSLSTTTSASMSSCVTTTAKITTETPNNVDQAAGLLMAFANPEINSVDINSSTAVIADHHIHQSPLRSSSQYMISSNESAASPPPTPPSQVSSACLLIEAAVGPLESNLNGNSTEIHSAEFKYPLQAKTKKHLMNNWLHQSEDNSADNILLPEQNPQSLQTPAIPIVSNVEAKVSPVSGGLDSLLQAAMSDLKQAQSDGEVPQNLSIAAQKVEEFIQQTEASSCPRMVHPQPKHSFEFQQHQISYANLPTPAVDLTLKTPLTIGPNPSSEMSTNNNTFHSPLQVSTCSNNSSVKKRWLRQAISEETNEEHTFSMNSVPIGGSVNNCYSNSQLQPVVSCSNYVPNGFTTPLKKRRLLLTGKDDVDENLCVNFSPSPPPVLTLPQQQTQQQQNDHNHQQFQIQFDTLQKNKKIKKDFNKDIPENFSLRDMNEDIDIDVEKYELNEAKPKKIEEEYKPQLQEPKFLKIEVDEEHDVDVTTSSYAEAPLLENAIKTIKHENDSSIPEPAEKFLESSGKQTDNSVNTEFNDQEDDVDILRSPSPGREMIKAEDNLVKIEPEDTSGMEDVKIDVEREESMAADDDVVAQLKERKNELTSQGCIGDEPDNIPVFSEKPENKNDFNIANVKNEDAEQKQNLDIDVKAGKSKGEYLKDLGVDNDFLTGINEPKSKKLKMEKSETGQQQQVVTKSFIKRESLWSDKKCIKTENITTTPIQNQQTPFEFSTKENENVLKIDTTIKKKDDAIEVTSSVTTSLVIKSAAADSTFADIDAITPPPPLTPNPAPIQRHKSLSDDDIQARLHSFHKENILFLQSRNKKTKSSSSLPTSSANSNSSSTNCLGNNNNDNHKNRTSLSSSSSNHQHHPNHHHHHHEGKEKSDKSNLKHRKSCSIAPGKTSKKQKLHKRERTTSSSGSNSHKNSTNLLAQPPSALNKNGVTESTSTSSLSSKKIKSLKKSSSGSSTTSNTSVSSYSASTFALQNLYPSSSSTTAPTPLCFNSDKERASDKDKHHRQRTTSSGNNNINSSNFPIASAAPYPSSKKRQLNFELELTKDMHLVNSIVTGGNKNKRETSRLISDEQGHIVAKKSKKESSLSQKDDLKIASNKTGKLESQQDKKISSSTFGCMSNKQSVGLNISTNSQHITTTVNNTSELTPTTTPMEEPKFIPTIVSQTSHPPQITTSILREHPTLPHFNNVVIATSSHQQTLQPSVTPVQTQTTMPVLSQNIPNHVNSSSLIASIHSNHPPLPLTPPSAGGVSSPLSTPTVNSTSHLPFYNTIYGKLLDNCTPPTSLPTPMTPSTTTPPPLIANASVPTGGSSVLSEYLDTKLKSYNTLGGYVSHTALFGLNNSVVMKDSSPMSVVSSSTVHSKDTTTEMPAPLVPSLIASNNSVPSFSSSTGASNGAPLKIHTKTASHDPRLNPQLTAPEPPPQPKRKLSINEYRKRMQQSSSNDSNSGSGGLSTTPTTPTSLDSLLGPMTMPLTSKCTLNSPDRLTQSVDSQIQKEIMSTTSAVSSSSSLDSLNSSNSSTSLNDTLLKSSSFVEEDCTKGQFNAAPTLLEKQQESLCARLKSLKEKQSLGTSFSVGSGNRSRFSSFSESVASGEFGLRKEDDELDFIRNRNLSISSSIGGGDLLDNCLEEISSTSTSMSSSREPSPDRCYSTRHKVVTASATTTMTNTSATSHSSIVQTTRQQQQHHQQQHNINCDKSDMTSLERKKSVDLA